VRERAAGTAECLAKQEVGARDIIQHGGVYQLVACLSDPALPVRDAAYKVGGLIRAVRNCNQSGLICLCCEGCYPQNGLLPARPDTMASRRALVGHSKKAQ